MGKHLLDETAEFKLPGIGRHAAADEDELEATQRFDPGLRPQRPVPGVPQVDLRLAARAVAEEITAAGGQAIAVAGDIGDTVVLGISPDPPAKLARLTALKDAVDPDNVFHVNPNVRPRDP